MVWLEMLDARNRMSYTYDALDVMSLYDRLLEFVGPLKDLVDTLAGVK